MHTRRVNFDKGNYASRLSSLFSSSPPSFPPILRIASRTIKHDIGQRRTTNARTRYRLNGSAVKIRARAHCTTPFQYPLYPASVPNYGPLDSGIHFTSARCEHDCFSVRAVTVIAGENRVNVATRPRHEV